MQSTAGCSGGGAGGEAPIMLTQAQLAALCSDDAFVAQMQPAAQEIIRKAFMLQDGLHVTVRGLRKPPNDALNGMEGKLLRLDEKTNKWHVSIFQNKKVMAISKDFLVLTEPSLQHKMLMQEFQSPPEPHTMRALEQVAEVVPGKHGHMLRATADLARGQYVTTSSIGVLIGHDDIGGLAGAAAAFSSLDVDVDLTDACIAKFVGAMMRAWKEDKHPTVCALMESFDYHADDHVRMCLTRKMTVCDYVYLAYWLHALRDMHTPRDIGHMLLMLHTNAFAEVGGHMLTLNHLLCKADCAEERWAMYSTGEHVVQDFGSMLRVPCLIDPVTSQVMPAMEGLLVCAKSTKKGESLTMDYGMYYQQLTDAANLSTENKRKLCGILENTDDRISTVFASVFKV